MLQLTITKTDFETLLVRHIFHIHFQEIEGSVKPGWGITPLLHSFLNVQLNEQNCSVQQCKTSARAPMAKYRYIIGL